MYLKLFFAIFLSIAQGEEDQLNYQCDIKKIDSEMTSGAKELELSFDKENHTLSEQTTLSPGVFTATVAPNIYHHGELGVPHLIFDYFDEDESLDVSFRLKLSEHLVSQQTYKLQESTTTYIHADCEKPGEEEKVEAKPLKVAGKCHIVENPGRLGIDREFKKTFELKEGEIKSLKGPAWHLHQRLVYTVKNTYNSETKTNELTLTARPFENTSWGYRGQVILQTEIDKFQSLIQINGKDFISGFACSWEKVKD